MVKDIFDGLKLIFSKDFRETFLDIFKLIRSSKEWKKDISVLTGKFSIKNQEETTLIIGKGIAVLKTKDWNENELKDVRFLYNEIVSNAFEHGIKNIDNGVVKIKMTLTPFYIKLEVTDNGKGFDLNQELVKQGAFEGDIEKSHGLSFVCRLTPEISQSKTEENHTVIVLRKQGIRPLKIRKVRDVTIFDFDGVFEDSGHYWNKFIEKVNLLKKKDKVILNFGANYSSAKSRAISSMTEEFKKVEKKNKVNIAVCGLDNLSYVIEEYFQFHFESFETIVEALDYFKD